MQLAESYRQGLWDGDFGSLKMGQEQDCLALLKQVQNLIAAYEGRLHDAGNRTEIQTILNDIKEILSPLDASSKAQ